MIDDLLRGAERAGVRMSRRDLERVVATNDKQRFAIDATGTRIRANQGHSIEVDLGLEPVPPPDVLYHGTHPAAARSIARDGIRPMGRRHVHLSPDVETARQVGARRGTPVILRVDARRMARDGHLFYRAANGVWLTDRVPPWAVAVDDRG